MSGSLGGGVSGNSSISQTYTNCTGTTQSGYTITPLTHGQTLIFTKIITGGTGSLSATCTNGLLNYGTETATCGGGYYVSGNSCVLSQSNPSSLSLVQTPNNKTFTVSWTAGTSNGGAGGCKLRYQS